MFLKLAVCIFLCISDAYGAGVDKAKLKIQVSGRNLGDDLLIQSDPYYELFYSTDMGKSKTKIGKSDTINSQKNPDWGNVFEFDFDRSKNQYLYFHVYDEDNLRKDDTLGRVWVNVADYVDKGQMVNAELDKDGYLMIKSADGNAADLRSVTDTPGQLQLPKGASEMGTLRFSISANNIRKKDDILGIIPKSGDPYVIIKAQDGISGSSSEIGRSATIHSTTNPNWSDIFTFSWNYKKDQRFHFKIYDDDTLRRDDKIDEAWIQVNDYVAHGERLTVILPKKGTLTIQKA